MISKSSEIPSLLYHYTTKEILIEHILKSYSLKLGSFKDTNDPKENKFSSIGITINGVFETKNNIVGRAQVFFEDVRFKEWNILCLTMDPECPNNNEKIDEHIKDISNAFKLGSSLASMWAHYASKHAGVCLVLDGKALYENINKLVGNGKIYHGPITYNNVTKSALDAYHLDINCENIDKLGDRELEEKIRNHVRSFYREIFLSKFADWSSENEYRFLINKINHDDYYVDLNGVLKKIILGQHFNPAYYPCVTTICEKKNIPVCFIDWQNDPVNNSV